MKTIKNKGIRIKKREALMNKVRQEDPETAAKIAAIQALIPMGAKLVIERLKAEVTKLAGPRYKNRDYELGRHGSNPGSAYVYDQKVRVPVPRVKHKKTGEEIGLASYALFQEPTTIDEVSLNRIVHGISTGNYEETVLKIPESMGLKRNSVSEKWIRSSAKKLQALQERDLSGYDIVAMFNELDSVNANGRLSVRDLWEGL